MPNSFDVISIGDSTTDVFLQIHDAEVRCSLDKQSCKLCVNYADKIAVDSMCQTVAGNAANNAVGSSRLDLRTAIYTSIGGDQTGHNIFNKFRTEKVDTRFVKKFPKMESNFSTVINFKGERTIFVYHQPWHYKLPKLPLEAKWVYYTSVGKGFETMHPALLAYLKRTGGKLGFNPGTHQRKGPLRNILPIIEATHTFFFNKEEACDLLRKPYSTPFKVLLRGIKELGPQIVVITDGPKGSTCYDGEEFREIGIYNVPIVERTGVGDAYATAFIAAEIAGKNIDERMRWGTLNSSGVVQFIGPQQGLRTKRDIEKIMASNPRFTKAHLL